MEQSKPIEYHLHDLINIRKLRELVESFHLATDTPIAILDKDKKIIVALGWEEICTRFHRACPESEKACRKSDAYIEDHLCEGSYVSYQCANGLIDVAYPIVVDDYYLGAFYIGQFFYDPPDEAYFVRQAERYGYDTDAYLQALRKVKVISRERVHQLMLFFMKLVEMLTDAGYENLRRRRAEQKYRTLFEHMSQGVVYHDADGRVIDANAAAEIILGRSRSELKERGADQSKWHIYHRDGSKLPARDFPAVKALTSGKPAENETVGFDHSKLLERRWLNITAIPEFRKGEKKPYQVFTTFSDITDRKVAQEKLLKARDNLEKQVQLRTAELEEMNARLRTEIEERKRMEDDLRRNKAKYQRLVEGAPDIIYAFSKSRGSFYVSHRVESILGYSPDYLAEHPFLWYQSIHKDDKPLVDAAIGQISDCQGLDIEYRIRDVVGNWKWFRDRSIGIHTDGGEVSVEGVATDITEQKRALAFLEDTRNRLAQIIDFLPDPTWVVDREGIVIAWNKAIETLTGIPASQMLGQGDYAYAIPFYGERRPVLIDQVISRNHSWDDAYLQIGDRADRRMISESHHPQLKPGGCYLWGTAQALDDGQGNIVGAIETIRDITDRKRTENALKESEERFRLVVEQMPFGVAISHLDGRNEYFNPKFTEMFGYSPEEILNAEDWWPQAYPNPEYRAETMTLWSEAVRSAHRKGIIADPLERDVVCKNGEIRTFEFRYTPLGDKGLTLFSDITQRKQREDRLRYYEIMASDIDAMLSFIDKNYVYQQINNAYQQAFSLSREEILGHTVTEVIGEEAFATSKPHYDQSLRGESNTEERWYDFPRHGRRFIRIKRFPVMGPGGDIRGVAVIITDHTDIRRIQDHLRRAYADLQQKNARLESANEELNQYAYVVSHDLKTPLRAIHNYADFLREDLADALDEDIRLYLDGLGKAVVQSEELVDDLLSLSRIGRKRGEVEKISVQSFLEMLISEFSFQEKIDIEIHDPMPEIISDPLLLRQIFQNLISNGIKFNRSDTIRIDIGCQQVSPGYYRFQVRDNGIGIAPQCQDQIFRVFQRLHTRQEFEGTGIGLAIVKKAVETLKGEIALESEPGGGSTFHVTLPAMITEELYA